MNNLCEEFLARICKLAVSLEQARLETLHYWEPDSPPVTTLFASIGARIAEDYETWSPTQKEEVFATIEEGMAAADETLVAAVATGLIEALVGGAFGQNRWNVIKDQLGPFSRSHAIAWAGE